VGAPGKVWCFGACTQYIPNSIGAECCCHSSNIVYYGIE
jgi:hypothetical protein